MLQEKMAAAGVAVPKRGKGTGNRGLALARASHSARTAVGPSKSGALTRGDSATTSRKNKESISPSPVSAASKATGRDHGQVPAALSGQDMKGVPSLCALSVADVVVAEYEKLLAAIPTMAKHMGKLQSDTEAMAEGLEKRVRSLVDGYRELNELVEQAPSRLNDAALEYANTLDVPPQGSKSAFSGDVINEHVSIQSPDIEGIHRELFALREAKLAIDGVVMSTAVDLQDPIAAHRTKSSSGRRKVVGGALGGTGLSKRTATTRAVEGRTEQAHRVSASSVTAAVRGSGRGGRAVDMAASRAMAGGAGTKRSSVRRVLAEVQLDPDLPLPLPTFPGNGNVNTLEGVVKWQQQLHQVGSHGQHSNFTQPLRTNSLPGDLKHKGTNVKLAEVHRHGYFVPGVVAPRQRQSHGLPQELRAISTVPTPEKRPAKATSSSGKRRRLHSRSSAASIKRGTTSALPLGPQAPAITSEARRVVLSSARPDPGSAAAMALSREQRRYTSQAVDELRKEMREREDRLERELDRRIRSRSPRVGKGAPAAFGGASSREPPKVVAKAGAAGGRSGAASATRGRGPKGRRRLLRDLASQRKPAATYRVPVNEENDRRTKDSNSSQTANKPAEAVDVQAQTANARVHVFLHSEPIIGDVLGTAADKRQPVPKDIPASGSHDQAQQTGRGVDRDGGHCLDDASLTSSSVSGGDVGLSSWRRGGLRESPPPPVVFIEGEGRNTVWRPSDDDRLLRRGGGGNSLRNGGITNGAGAEVLREAIDGGDSRLIHISPAEEKKEEGSDPKPGAVTVTTGRAGLAASMSQQLAAAVQDDVWVELAGMLSLSASEPTTAGLSNTSAPIEPASTREAVRPLPETPMVSPELLDLMREVVGQQRDMGEERSALMQALRAEVESRRLLLANQELSLRERELALEKRESEPLTTSMTSRLAAAAAAAATAAIAEQYRQRQEKGGQGTITIDGVEEGKFTARPPREERFWPGTSDQEAGLAESDSEWSREGLRAVTGDGQNGIVKEAAVILQEKQDSDRCGEASGQQPSHPFRSNLGRVLAAGSGWRDVPLDEIRAPRKVFSTSLGRLLAGDQAWQRLRLGEGLSAHGGASPGRVRGSNDHTLEEFLCEAERQASAGADTGVSSPQTAVRKRASALESRRFSKAMAEVESKWPVRGEREDGGIGSPCDSGESEYSASEESTRIQTAPREGFSSPFPTLVKKDAPPDATQQPQQQPQLQDSGRLNLSLATAVLSVAQRLSTVEERASAKAEGAEDLARQALEDTRQEGKEARERQSQLIFRLKEMELGSERRAKVFAGDIAKLREEGRFERQGIDQPSTQAQAPATPRHSSLSRGVDSSNTSESGSSLDALCLAAAPLRSGAYHQPIPARSESRSSMSEGQLRGYFSDGELLNSTPRSNSRYTLEDGELPPSPLRSPLPVRGGEESVIDAAGSVAGRDCDTRGDPRKHLALLMSAHPHLEANRPSMRGLQKNAHAHDHHPSGGRGGGTGDLRQGTPAGMGLHGSGIWRLRPPEPTTKPNCPREVSVADDRVDDADNGSSLSDSGQSVEPGQVRTRVLRSWQESEVLTSDRGGGMCDRRAGGGQIELGSSWRRKHQAASEDSTPSAGEASSGVEMGETLATFLDDSIDRLSTDVGEIEERRGGMGARNTRPLVALHVGAGSTSDGQRAEIQRAIAEAELDLRTVAAQDCRLNGPVSESVQDDRKAADWKKTAGGRKHDGIGGTGDLFGDVTKEAAPAEGAGSRERLEPGEVP